MDVKRPSPKAPSMSELPLFKGVAPEVLPRVLACLHASYRYFERGETLLREGDSITDCLYIVEGAAQLVTTDAQGRKSILHEYHANDAIAIESFFSGASRATADVTAIEPTTVLSITITQEVARKARCMEHIRPVRHNLAKALARTNRALVQRLHVVSRRTTREKVLAYLRAQADQAGSNTFTVPHTRQDLADFLYVERTALSHELSKLQADGLISFHRNQFTLSAECLEEQPRP